MSLEVYQYLLCRMVASGEFRTAVERQPNESLDHLDLTEVERRRLLSVAAQPGMRVNTAIHRANRLATVAQTMPFTCFLLSKREQIVFDRYWSAHPTESLQLPIECERFASFLETQIASGEIDDPYLDEVVRFERACTLLRFYTSEELKTLGCFQDGLPELVRVIRFQHDPVALLDALTEFQIPPEDLASGEFHLAIDFRSGEAEFRLLDEAGVRALRGAVGAG